MNKLSKGFTIIELLSVIAIIIILSSITIVSLEEVRKRARDAKIISSISQVRSVAEIIYLNSNSYNNLCSDQSNFSSTQGLNIIQEDIINNIPENGQIRCMAENLNYCIAVSLYNNGSFCISSDGMANIVSSSSLDACNTPLSKCSQ